MSGSRLHRQADMVKTTVRPKIGLFLERIGFFAAFLDTRPLSKLFASLCLQMHSKPPVDIELALHWW